VTQPNDGTHPDRAAVVVASNRGPVSFDLDDSGALTMRRGGGGLVSGLSAAARNGRTVWVCAALSKADRVAARRAPGGRLDRAGPESGLDGIAVRMLDIDQATFHRAYNAVANSVLWFVNHMLYDTATKPVFDRRWLREWQGYVAYNEAFAEALAEEATPGASVLIQDYHLTLAPAMLRSLRPDLRIAHFTHTPWAPPEYFTLLPDSVAAELLTGMLGADSLGFLSPRWADAFRACCARVLGAQLGPDGVEHSGRTVRTRVHALGADADDLLARAAQADVEARRGVLQEIVGGRKLILRIDRTELSKNIVRGLAAYRELLRDHPEWHGRVVHLAFAYPSRHDLPEYREYTAAVQRIAAEIEDEFASDDWTPLVLEVNDDFPRSLAAYTLADVLVVNPIRDGMNLVAKEGPVLSEKGVALVLSREAGAADELAPYATMINPYDVTATAAAMHEALSLDDATRADRCKQLAEAATALPPAQWLADQLDALASGRD
jgi:trehalose 6-phosphate synthase